jgi:hypothetical protein
MNIMNPSPKPKTLPLSWIALMRRINRHLEKDQKTIVKLRARDGYFMIDLKKEEVASPKLSTKGVEKLARQLQLIEPWEEVR